jgi:EAL domain-containing protein (putative c-di-GMP-specific phosphodiesterase class I)
VIAQAMRAVATLAAAGHDLRISVNLTARDLLDRSLPPTVAAMLSASGIAPHRLGFEVTESSLIIDFESAVANLHALRTLGCRTSVDDFGTGYASLQYLQRLPIDEVKIDRSFVAGATTNSDSQSIVRSTTRLLHDLHLQVVAEGVEDQPTLDLLRTIGCDLAQGFLFAKAMPVEEFVRWTDDYIMPRRATSRWETSTNSPVRIS